MIAFFVKRPVATSMLFAAVLLLGSISLARLKVSLFPDIVFPKLTVLTPYANVAPEEIENLVTRPIEDAVSSVNGVKKIVSRSQEGLSIVEVSLEWGASLDLATINIRQKVDLTRSVLPQDTGKSIIVKFDPSADPVVTMIARPVDIPFKNLRDYVDKNVRPFMERINGVASISILGGYHREIQVNVDSEKLYGYGISLDQIIQSLSSANFNFPAGNVKKGDREFTVRVQGEFLSVKEIADTVVSLGENGTPVYLYQVAEVKDAYRDRTGASLYNGEPAVVVGIKKEPGKNTIDTAENVYAALQEINKRFERSVRFDVIQDRSRYISASISSVRNAALLGGLIAFIILFLFLKDIRAALIVVISIPFAVISTFVLMYVRDISLNIMSLGGLALGVGMLVDNSIVVLESIYQQKEAHPERDARTNSINGANNVIASVTASTLTSIIVFVPIVFVSGIAGEVFRDLALTVSFSLISSLFCALSLIPMLAALQPVPDGKLDRWSRAVNRRAEPLFQITESWIVDVRDLYLRTISRALERPLRVLAIAFGLAAAGALLLWPLEKRLFPDVDQGEVAAVMELPGGTVIADSEALHRRVHGFLTQNNLSVHAVTDIGFDEEDLSSRIKGVRKGNYSESNFYINRAEIDSARFIAYVQRAIRDIGGLESRFRIKGDALQELLGESGNRILFEVESSERDSARKIANWVEAQIQSEESITSIKSTATARDPEVKLFLDRQKISSFGITPESVARVIRTAVHGGVSTIYREDDREIDVRVRLRENDRRQIDQLHRLFIQTGQGSHIELGKLIRTDDGLGYPSILRENQRRLERLEIEFSAGEKDAVRELLEGIAARAREQFPELFAQENKPELNVREENEETIESLSNLTYAFLLSSILIYQLLAPLESMPA